MSVDFQNAVPRNFLIPQPVSTSKSVLRKTLMEMLPVEQTTFSPGGNDIISFNISSNRDFLSGPESYIRFVIQKSNGNENSSFDIGGANSLIKTVEIRALASGILLQRYDNYNRKYAIDSLLLQTEEEVEQAGWAYGDGLGWGDLAAHPNENSVIDIDGQLGNNAVNTTTNIITLTSNDAQFYAQIGDILEINYDDSSNVNFTVHGVITDIPNVNEIEINSGAIPGAAGASNFVYYARVHRRRINDAANRNRFLRDTTARTVCLKLRVSMLDHYLPLFLMKGGIELRLTLEHGARAVVDGRSPADVGGSPADYTITVPRLMAMMVTPHGDVLEEYVRQWKSPQGLLYNIPSVRTRRISGAVGSSNDQFQLHFGVRSARRAYLVVMDHEMSETTAANTAGNHSISTFVRSFINKYQFKIGSHEFPNREVDCGVESPEAYWQLKMVSGNMGPSRLRQEDYNDSRRYAYDGTATSANEARHFIIGVDLSRDNGEDSNLTGSDLSIVPLDVVLERSAAYNSQGLGDGLTTGGPVYYVFVEHDSYLKISQAQMSVMN
jgi:hypothetical protein